MNSFKLSSKNIFIGLVLILTAVVVSYLVHRENKGVIIRKEYKRTNNTDSSKQFNLEDRPAGMGLKPEVNSKDGSVKIIQKYIKSHAQNPSTFEFIEWSEVSTEGGYWKVRCKYRGISSFNKEVTTNAWFYIWNNKVVYTKVISKI